ncbi:N-acetylneuraminate synthase family protein [Maridesulfovibrio sp.]|uniref:N-acetylneuraminate synthase family protein n=1 Tax=Maridesulfovibrio sp. TaxID=2795000 RepID=UPI003BAAEE85
MKYNKEIFMGPTKISKDSPVYFIADIAANHDGSLERAKELIWKAAEAGADAAKFQHFAAKTIVSDYGFKDIGTQQSHQKKWKKSVYETYEDAAINTDWNAELKKTCDEAKIDFFTSPYSRELVDSVDDHVLAYKIGSGDITYIELIEYMATKGKPVFLATGASDIHDVERAMDAILKHTKDVVLMQCNTNYTGSVENFKYINLNVLNTFKQMYPELVLGLSDHTKGDSSVLGAVALGARVVEKHFTDDNDREGPDHAFSMTPEAWRTMVDRSEEMRLAMGSGTKVVEDNEKETVVLQRRAIRTTTALPAGHVITADDLIELRPAPADSFPPYMKEELIGKELTTAKSSGDALYKDDIKA